MELTEEKIITAVDKYFNVFLRNALGYPERYSVEFDSNRNRITLISNEENPILVEKLQDKMLRLDLENKLYRAFRSKTDDIVGVNVYPSNNRIIITYTQGETPVTLSEIEILAKLAADTDVEDLNKLCSLNKNFARACKNDLFWWEIIKLKFPELYVERRTRKYDPRKVIRGLRTYRTLKRKYGSVIDEKIEELSRDYPETFKYVFSENIFKISSSVFYRIYTKVDLSRQDNIEMIKYIISNIDEDDTSFNFLFYKLMRTPGVTTDLIEEIDEIVKKRGFELYNENLLRSFLYDIKTLPRQYRSEIHEWINNKLRRGL